MPFIASVEGQFGYGRAVANQIVQGSNLYIWIDSGNTKSYTSGTSWSNLVTGQSAYNFTLYNSPTTSNVVYNGTSNTSISFNGTNQYTTHNTSLVTLASNANWTETREFWIYWRGAAGGFINESGTITPDTNWFDEQMALSGTSLGFSVWQGTVMNAYLMYNALQSNAWNHIVWQYTGKTNQNLRAYVNGVQQSNYTSVSRTTPDSIGSPFYLLLGAGSATNFGYSGNLYFNGTLAVFRWYNTTLTSNQIQQNYNAERARFGR